MSADLYEPCTLCDHFRGRICPSCQGAGFVKTGLTAGQAERLARLYNAIHERIHLLEMKSRLPAPDGSDPGERARDQDRVRAALAELRALLDRK